MLGPLLETSTLPLLEKLSAFGERRHEVLAGNLANIDTPDYRMRDLPVADFQAAMRAAIAGTRESASGASGASAAGASPGSQPASPAEAFPRELFEVVESPPDNLTSQDANNRSIEHQVSRLTKNAMLQTFAVELMTAQYSKLEMVISERP